MTKKKPKSAQPSPYSKLPALAGALTGSLLVILLSCVSLDLGVLAGGIMVLCIVYTIENRRREIREDFLERTLKSLQSRQNAIERTLEEQRKNLAALRDDLDENRKHIEDRLAQPPAPAPEKHRKIFSPVSQAPASASVRPGKSAIIRIANDEASLDDDSLSDLVVRELLHAAVAAHDIDLFMQPVVRLPQRQMRFYELFARIRAKPGVSLPAARYMGIAKQDSLLSKIDRLMLIHSLRMIQGSQAESGASGYFLNIKPSTLKNPEFMKRLLGFLSRNKSLASSLIFEIRQDYFNETSEGEKKILAALAELGCRYSLDHIKDLPSDIKALQKDNIRFLKIPAGKMLAESVNDKRFADMARRKRILEANGIGVIVEKIESEEELRELLDYTINYGQGYLFGKPATHSVYEKAV